MTKSIITKALSVILVIAVCMSTLSGLVSFSAASASKGYSVVADSVAAGSKKVTLTVTITDPNGIANGSFDLMFDKDIIDDVNFDANGNYVTPVNETVEEFRARDTDGNFMIAAVNYYKEEQYQSPIYDANGEITGYETKTRKVLDTERSYKENTGNKGVMLPNAYDGKIGLYDTKIEITGGTKANGTFDIKDFSNSAYATMADADDKGTQAIEGAQNVGGTDYKYAYNLTDGYKITHYNSNPINNINVVEGENTVSRAVLDMNLLDKYYREYTTVDVATQNLGYKISTVSEDSGPSGNHSYAQYAQGFKDITFNSSVPYTSITFTVTLDFTGLSDRISANDGVESDKLWATTEGGINYRLSDGHWANENYIQYGTKYQMNFVNAKGDIASTSAADGNAANNFFHVHGGVIENSRGTDEPVNKAAIDALKAKNQNAKEGVDYFELYNARCIICNRVSPMIAAPDLPYRVNVYDTDDKTVLEQIPATDTKGIFSFNNYRNISGASVVYNDDGSLALNIHYPSTMDGEQLFITDENGMIMKYSDTLDYANDDNSVFSAKPSHFAAKKLTETYIQNEEELTREIGRYEGAMMSSAHMVTVEGFSAADIDKTLYIARYTPSSNTETQLMGITHSFSIADYCNKVINDEAVYYDEDYSASNTTQDKILAAALINYANSSKTALSVTTPTVDKVIPTEIDMLEFGDYLLKAGSSSTYYDTNVADNGETGEDWDNAIIIDSAEEFVYIAKTAENDTDGKYYKVADNILAFNLSTSSLDLDGTLEDNLAIIQGSGKNHSGGAPGFQGHFDGNGVTIYGAWGSHKSISPYSGVFSCAQGDVTIKNVNVKLSSFTATTAAGGIVGYYKGEGNYTSNTTLTIENCSVTDSHLEVTGKGYNTGIGAIVGRVDCPSSYIDVNDEDGDKNTSERFYVNNQINVKNCYVNLDEAYFTSAREDSSTVDQICHGGAVAVAGTNAVMVSDSIIIGVTPYATTEYTAGNAIQHTGHANNFSNVYTDQPSGTSIYVGGNTSSGLQNLSSVIFQRTKDQLTGENAKNNTTNLNWNTVWCVNVGDYPSLYAPYNIPELEPRTIYWDGSNTKTAPSTGSGTKKEPYIINTVSELAYVVGQTKTNYGITDGKYFKIADDIEAIVLQPQAYGTAIMALNSAAETKAYFEANASNMKQWLHYGWEGSTFCGNIDFNGATVYGIYQISDDNTGLISNLDAGAVIKNLTVKNSYMISKGKLNNDGVKWDDYQVGAIAGNTNGANHGKKTNGIIWFNNCTVANNYMYNNSTSHDRSGVLMGASSDVVYVDNCFVYGNDATYGSGVNMPLLSSANNSTPDTVAVPDGLVTKIDYTEDGKKLHFNMVRNSIILGCNPYDVKQEKGNRFNEGRAYESVYTDAITVDVVFTNGKYSFTPAQIARITVDDIKGLNAKNAMPNLDWYDAATNPDGSWYCSYLGNVPSLTPFNESIVDTIAQISPEVVNIYNNIVFDDPDVLGEGTKYHENGSMSFGVYQTALSLKSNPYMSFAFAFLDNYQKNRDKIKIRFVYDDVTTEEISVPECEYNADGSIKDLNKDGWTNKKSNGRYHTYKATNLPISALLSGITVQMSYDGGEWKNYGTYSIEGLGYQFEQLNAKSPSEYYQTRIEALKALVLYIEARSNRFNMQ